MIKGVDKIKELLDEINDLARHTDESVGRVLVMLIRGDTEIMDDIDLAGSEISLIYRRLQRIRDAVYEIKCELSDMGYEVK